MPTTTHARPMPPAAVLDTNVVLDWLVFLNPACDPLAQALEAGRLRWISTQAMRDELAHVLSRGVVDAWNPNEAMLWNTWDRLSQTVVPAPPALIPRLRCTDPDDQKFIELALDGARWLISRDRAVLKLSRRAAKWGVRMLTPEQWAHQQMEAAAASG